MEPWVVSTGLIFIYLIATIVIGILANRKGTANMEDFFLYGRQAGFIVLYLTVVATFHSAFAFLGSGGFFFTHGIGFWMAGTWTVLVGGITFTLGTRIWALGKRFGYITPADMIADFYESESVRVIVALVSVVFTLIYIQVQATGLGYILSVATGDRIPFGWASLILLVVAAGYLMVGGLRAVYWTDVIQGIWMYIAVWAGSLVLTYKLFGGPVQLWRRLAAERPDLLSLPGPEGFFSPGMWVGMTIALSFGIIFQPHMMIRYFSAASSRTIKILGATTPIYLMTLFIPVAFVGLGGALILPDLAQPDRIFPELLFRYAPPWLTGLILAGATAAAMSTLDSILHANMTVLTRDVYQRYIARDRSQKHYLAFGRWVVVALLGVGWLLTQYNLDFLVTLVLLSGAGALQLMPAVLAVCYPARWRTTAAGVVSGISAGLVTLFLTRVVFYQPLGMHEALWSLLVNFAVMLTVSAFTRPPSVETVERIHGEIERFVYGR